MSDDRPAVYVEESGLVVYRASGLDMCPADLLAFRLGETPKPFTEEQEEVMAEGRLHEPDIVEWLKLKGYQLRATGDEQHTYELPVIPGQVVIRCHPDGLASGNGLSEEHVLEVKSASRGNFLRGWEHFKRWYIYQFTAEMYCAGNLTTNWYRPLLLAIKNRDSGRKKTEFLSVPPVTLSDLRQRVMSVEIAARLGKELGCTGEKFFCRFPWHSGGRVTAGGREEDSAKGRAGDGSGEVATSSPATAEPRARGTARDTDTDAGEVDVDAPDLVGLASAYVQLRAREKTIEDEMRSVRDGILAQLGDRKQVRAGIWKVGVRWQERETVTISKVPAEIMEQLRQQRDPRCVTKSRYPVIAVTAPGSTASAPTGTSPGVVSAETAGTSSPGMVSSGSTLTEMPSPTTTDGQTTSPIPSGDGELMEKAPSSPGTGGAGSSTNRMPWE